jgi:hypothetical protein
MRRFSTLFLIFFFSLQPVVGRSTEFFVSPQGSDSNNGTSIEAPLRTIQKAADMVTPGDAVNVRGGVYREKLRLHRSGTPEQSIVFRAFEKEQPVIDGSPTMLWSHHTDRILTAEAPFPVGVVVADGRPLSPIENITDIKPGFFFLNGPRIYIAAVIGSASGLDGVAALERFTDWASYRQTPLVQIAGNYVDFIGFTVQNSSGSGIECSGSFSHIIDCRVAFTMTGGVLMSNVLKGVIQGCTVTETCLMNWPRGKNSDWPGAVTYLSGKEGRIVGNHVFRNHGEGIGTLGGWGLPGTSGLEIRKNTVSDNWSVNIWIDHGSHVLIDGNFVFVSPEAPAQGKDGSTPVGIECAEEADYGYPGDLGYVSITNNIVIGDSIGFMFWNAGSQVSGLKHFHVANNTFANNRQCTVYIEKGKHIGTVFRNNIFYQETGNLMHFETPNDTRFEHNCWYEPNGQGRITWCASTLDYATWCGLSGSCLASIWKNPAFSVGVGLDPQHYQIRLSSPCRDSAADDPLVTLDYWGIPRPVGPRYDIGAHELKSLP